MARIAKWCVLGACTALAACLTNSNGTTGPTVFDPVLNALDGAPPFGASTGVPVSMLSADRDGVLDATANIVFNANGTFTLDLPNGLSVTVAESDIDVAPEADTTMKTTVTSYVVVGATTQVDIHLGEDTLGSDLFFLGRVDSITGVVPRPLTWVAFGDDTETLPTGTAAYTGGFHADLLNSTTGAFIEERTGDSVINADFDAVTDHIDITLSVTGAEGSGETYGGTGSFVSGGQYGGTLASTGGLTSFAGSFNGAFYGPDAEATAGTFNATDAGAGTELVGGFTGFK